MKQPQWVRSTSRKDAKLRSIRFRDNGLKDGVGLGTMARQAPSGPLRGTWEMHKVTVVDAAIQYKCTERIGAQALVPCRLFIIGPRYEMKVLCQRCSGAPRSQLACPGVRLVQTGNSPLANMVRYNVNGASNLNIMNLKYTTQAFD